MAGACSCGLGLGTGGNEPREAVIAVEFFDHLEQRVDGAVIAMEKRVVDRLQRVGQPLDLQTHVAVGPIQMAVVERPVDLAPHGADADFIFEGEEGVAAAAHDIIEHVLAPLRFFRALRLELGELLGATGGWGRHGGLH